MPHSIADSDDDGDDTDFVVGDEEDSATLGLDLSSNGENKEAVVELYDGTNEKSTGSTGTLINLNPRLRR